MSGKKRNDIGGLLAGVIAAAVFLLLVFLLNMKIIFGLIAAAVAYIAGILISLPALNKNDITLVTSGITKAGYDVIMQEAEEKALVMSEVIKKMPKGIMKDKSLKILDVVERIIEDLKKDPQDIKAARQFLSYYLDSTIKIFEKYVDIYSKRSTGTNVNELLSKVENTLDTLYTAYENQLTKLMENDILDLDTELEVLKNTLKAQGLES